MLAATGPRGAMLMGDGAIDPGEVAEAVMRGMRTDAFLILPHPEVAAHLARKAGDVDRWLAAMNRLQQRLEQLPGSEAP